MGVLDIQFSSTQNTKTEMIRQLGSFLEMKRSMSEFTKDIFRPEASNRHKPFTTSKMILQKYHDLVYASFVAK